MFQLPGIYTLELQAIDTQGMVHTLAGQTVVITAPAP
jgi:hypothetical protein